MARYLGWDRTAWRASRTAIGSFRGTMMAAGAVVLVGGAMAGAPVTGEPQPEGVVGIKSTGGSPVILLEGDLNREMNHVGLEPTKLLRASGWRGLYRTSKGHEVRDARRGGRPGRDLRRHVVHDHG